MFNFLINMDKFDFFYIKSKNSLIFGIFLSPTLPFKPPPPPPIFQFLSFEGEGGGAGLLKDFYSNNIIFISFFIVFYPRYLFTTKIKLNLKKYQVVIVNRLKSPEIRKNFRIEIELRSSMIFEIGFYPKKLELPDLHHWFILIFIKKLKIALKNYN